MFEGLHAVAPDVPGFTAKLGDVEEQAGYEEEALGYYNEAIAGYDEALENSFDSDNGFQAEESPEEPAEKSAISNTAPSEEASLTDEVLTVLLRRATLLCKLGEKEDARETLERIISQAGEGSSVRTEAQQMLSGL